MVVVGSRHGTRLRVYTRGAERSETSVSGKEEAYVHRRKWRKYLRYIYMCGSERTSDIYLYMRKEGTRYKGEEDV